MRAKPKRRAAARYNDAVVSSHKPATFADLLLRDGVPLEIIDGEIVEKASPTFEHADAQAGLTEAIRSRFHGPPGNDRGGWWIVTECDVELEAHQVFRPDVVGWRRDRVPERPAGRPIRIIPDWVCEVLSPSNAETDLTKKLRVFQHHRVPHYLIVDPEHRVLTVFRWTEQGYLAALTAGIGEIVRAEPFEALELKVGALFGAD